MDKCKNYRLYKKANRKNYKFYSYKDFFNLYSYRSYIRTCVRKINWKYDIKETIIGEYINLNNYLIPSIIAILFTYLTLYRSIKKPVKLASEISPIEALKYNSTDIISFNNKKKIRKGTKGGKIKNMAYANIVKNKKKVALSVISIALSSTLFIFALVSGLGLDVDEHSKRYNIGDVVQVLIQLL